MRNKEETLFSFLNFYITIFNSVRKETIDFDSDALPEGVYFKNHRVKKSLVAALRERDIRKLANSERKDQDVRPFLKTAERREQKKSEKKDFARTTPKKHSRSQCWEYRKGNCTTPSCSEFGKKCAVRHQQTEEQSSQKREQKDKKIVAKLKMHDKWVEYFRTMSRRSPQGAYGRAPSLETTLACNDSQKLY